jgi:hypothetical protein
MMGADVVDEGSEIFRQRQKHPEQAESLNHPIPTSIRLPLPQDRQRQSVPIPKRETAPDWTIRRGQNCWNFLLDQ